MWRLFITSLSTLFLAGHVFSGTNIDILKAFAVTDEEWDQTFLNSKISVHLVKKSWIPEGVTYDQNIDEFPVEVVDAYNILKANTDYDYIERPLTQAGELFTVKGARNEPEFDHNLDSIIIIPGVPSGPDTQGHFSSTLVTAFGIRNLQKYKNIFLFHMPELRRHMINTVIRQIMGYKTHYEDMAKALCSFILDGVQNQQWEPRKINFLSYSYSGNLAGYMARIVKSTYNIKINSIMGLDPFSPRKHKYLTQVSKDDADVVHFLHSSSDTAGTTKRIGTADFVFNNGLTQPECSGINTFLKRLRSPSLLALPFICSHVHTITRLWYVIIFPSKFQARKCDSWPMFENCDCEGEKNTFVSYPIVNREVHGTFYIKTSGTKPYGLGDEGSHCSSMAKEKLDK